MHASAPRVVLVTGSTGKLGSVLRAVWPDILDKDVNPVWQVRSNGQTGDLHWNIGADPYPGPDLAGGVVVHLAGGRADLDANITLSLAVCKTAMAQGARHVFLASSSAVYAPDLTADLTEDTPPLPGSAYGRSKLEMEQAVTAWAQPAGADAPGVTFLRIGNVLGCDSLIGGLVPGRPVHLVPVPGRAGGPIRSYIGPKRFAIVMRDLCARALTGAALPQVLNFAAGTPVTMAALLDAAGAHWSYAPPDPEVLPRVVLAVDRLRALVDLPLDASDPAAMVAEWRSLPGPFP